MFPSKYKPIEKSKLYKAIVFYHSLEGFLIPKKSIVNYQQIEYLTILYAIRYIDYDKGDYFVKVFKS